jgi:hypothetical protein
MFKKDSQKYHNPDQTEVDKNQHEDMQIPVDSRKSPEEQSVETEISDKIVEFTEKIGEITNKISVFETQLTVVASKVRLFENNFMRIENSNAKQLEVIKQLNATINDIGTSIRIVMENGNKLGNNIENNQSVILSEIRENHHLEGIVHKQSEQIQKLQGDLYKKIQLPLINSIIQIADFSRRTLENVNNIEESKRLSYLRTEFESYTYLVEGILRNNMVMAFSDFKNGKTELNLDRQTPQSVIPTIEENKDGLVAESVQPGYVWNIPDMNNNQVSRIIRPEVVNIYEYREEEKEHTDTSGLLDQTDDIIQKVTDDAEFLKLDGAIKEDDSLLVGGTSCMPVVENMIRYEYKKEPKLIDPDQAVVKGTTIYSKTVDNNR